MNIFVQYQLPGLLQQNIKNIFRITIEPNRIFGLDILRALAILFVVIGHGAYLLPGKVQPVSQLFLLDGVSIFFVLSGFLIGGILIKQINANGINRKVLFNFWIRRWCRTLPNYFLVLIILCILHLLFIKGFSFSSMYRYFFFSQNFYSMQDPWFFPEAWSLSVEEWFYLLVPVFIWGFIKIVRATPKQSVLLTTVIFILLVTAFRYYRYTTIPIETVDDWGIYFYKQVLTRLDSLMFGVIGAYIYFYHRELWLKNKKLLLWFGIILFLLSRLVIPEFDHIGSIYSTVFSFTVTSIATLSVLPYLSDLKAGKGFLFRSITWISLISYSMYLLNLSLIQNWIINNIPWNDLTANKYIIAIIKYTLYWFLLLTLSTILYKYFEKPMTKIRDRFTLRRGKQ